MIHISSAELHTPCFVMNLNCTTDFYHTIAFFHHPIAALLYISQNQPISHSATSPRLCCITLLSLVLCHENILDYSNFQ